MHGDHGAWACSSCWCPAASTSRSPPPPRSRSTATALLATALGPAGAALRRPGRPRHRASALGCVNAALIHYLRITSIIVTIATMSVYFALLMYFTGGKSIYDLPDWWSTRVVFCRRPSSPSGDLVRITLPIVVVALVALAHLAADDPLLGRPAALRDGRQPRGGAPPRRRHRRLHFLAYGYLGLLAGARRAWCRRTGSARAVPNAMVGNELDVLAAAVLGGASLTGGIGTVPGRAARHPAAGDPAERAEPARASRPTSSRS